jgi:hypothetical protein
MHPTLLPVVAATILAEHAASEQRVLVEAAAVPRQARCVCGRLEPSAPTLAFFGDRSAGSDFATKTCRHCGYHAAAHGVTHYRTAACSTFEPRTDGFEYDEYYCGCRGWD